VPAPAVSTPTNAPQSNATNTVYLTDPDATLAVGDLMVAHVRVGGTTADLTGAGLLGFTLAHKHQNAASNTEFILYKVADSTDVANRAVNDYYNFGPSSNVVSVTTLIRITGADTTTPVEAVNAVIAGATGTSFQIPEVTTLGADRLLLWLAGVNATTARVTWADATLQANELYDAGGGTNRAIAASYQTQAAAGASGTRDVTLDAVSGFTGTVLAIKSGAVAPAAPTGLTVTATNTS
jgi:hypothetical protein